MPIKRPAIVVLIVTMLMILLAGCSTKPAKAPPVSEIADKIIQSLDLTTMKPADASRLKKLYGLGMDTVEEFALYTAPSNLKADELAIFKVADPQAINIVKEKIEKRVEKLSVSFQDYLPDEYYLIQKHLVKTSGNYVILVISKDAFKVADVFKQCFKS